MGDDINVCLPNVPYSCRRAQKEGLCDMERDCKKCGKFKRFDAIGIRICQKSPELTKDDIMKLSMLEYEHIMSYKRKKPSGKYNKVNVRGYWRKRKKPVKSNKELYEKIKKRIRGA